MIVDYERLEKLIAEFEWCHKYEDSEGYDLVWSSDRNRVDPDFYFDECLREAGNEIQIESFQWSLMALTVGDWLYFGASHDLRDRHDYVLLRRVHWDKIELVDATKIRIVGGKES